MSKGKRYLTHPSRRRLREWLEDGKPSIDKHVESCARCAAKLEDLSQPTVPLADALRSMLAPPTDLQPRLRDGIARKLQAQQDMQLLGEMLLLPWQTAQAMSDRRPEPPAVS